MLAKAEYRVRIISVLPYALSFVLESKGISFTLRIETGIVALMVLCSLAFKSLIPTDGENDLADKKSANFNRWAADWTTL